MIRTKAVISLHKIAHDSNDKIIQVLSTTFQNPTESSEVCCECPLLHGRYTYIYILVNGFLDLMERLEWRHLLC